LERRRIEEDLKRREEEDTRVKAETEAATKRFLRETVYAVTDGKFNLLSYDEAREMCSEDGHFVEIDTSEKLASVRHEVTNAAGILEMNEDRIYSLVTAVGEAATNALKHAGGGVVSIYSLEKKLRVCIHDLGEGIESLILPTATLMTRYSTKRSMGFGYAIMLSSVDTVYLATGPDGTWTILEQAVDEITPEITLAQLQDVW